MERQNDPIRKAADQKIKFTSREELLEQVNRLDNMGGCSYEGREYCFGEAYVIDLRKDQYKIIKVES